MSRVLIEFTSDPSGLQPGIDTLEQLGVVDKQNADQFRKSTDAVKNYGKSVTDATGKILKDQQKVISSTEQLTNGFKNIGKSALGNVGIKTFEELRSELNKSQTSMQGLNALVTKGKELLANAAGKGGQEYEKLAQEIQAAESVLQTFGQSEEKINGLIRQNIQDIISLQNAMEQLQKEGKGGTDVFRGLQEEEDILTKNTAELKSQLDNIKKSTTQLSQGNIGFQALAEGAATFSASMQLVQGTMNLLGDENQEYQQALLRINSLMAITQAAQQISNTLLDQSVLKTYAAATAQKIYAAVVGETTGAYRIFRIVAASALAATGIGILIAIAANWDRIKAAISGVNDQLDTNVDLAKQNLEAQKAISEEYDLQIAKAKLRGASEEQVLRMSLEAKQKELEKIIDVKKAQDELTESVRKSNYERKLATSTGGIFLNPFAALAALFKKSNSDLKKSKEEAAEINSDYIKKLTEITEIEIALKKLTDEKLKELDDQRKKQQEKDNEEYRKSLMNRRQLQAEIARLEIENIKENNEERIKLLREQIKKEDDLYRESLVQRRQLEAEKEQLRLDELAKQSEDRRQRRRQEIEEEIKDESDKQQAIKDAAISITRSLADTIFTILAQNRQNDLQSALDSLEKQKDRELSNKNLTEAQKQRINERYAREEAKIKTKAAIDERNAKLAQAIINGALAITNILATVPGGPLNPLAIASIAVSAATTAAQIAIIGSTKIPQFRKGTKRAPSGFKWVGEDGPELINDAGGYPILTNGDSRALASLLDKYGIGHSILPPAPSIGVPAPSFSAETLERMQSVQQANGYASDRIDYERLGKVVGEEISKNQAVNLSFDKYGFKTYLTKGCGQTEIMNDKYGF